MAKKKKKEKYFLYLLKCGDNSLYTGITKDMERRLKEHQAGRGGKYTRSHLPVSLVYKEKCKDFKHAIQREIEVKKWPRAKKISLI